MWWTYVAALNATALRTTAVTATHFRIDTPGKGFYSVPKFPRSY